MHNRLSIIYQKQLHLWNLQLEFVMFPLPVENYEHILQVRLNRILREANHLIRKTKSAPPIEKG